MSGPIRRGLGANYTAQAWYALANVAIVPLFLQVFGAEAYGLVGAFLVLQACAVALDAGLSAAFARELVAMGQGRGGAAAVVLSMRRKERTIALIALAFALIVFAAAAYLASRWLDPVKLDPGTVPHLFNVLYTWAWFVSSIVSGLIYFVLMPRPSAAAPSRA